MGSICSSRTPLLLVTSVPSSPPLLSLGSFTFIWCCQCDDEKGSRFQSKLNASSPVCLWFLSSQSQSPPALPLGHHLQILKVSFSENQDRKKRERRAVCSVRFSFRTRSSVRSSSLHLQSLPVSHSSLFLLDIEMDVI